MKTALSRRLRNLDYRIHWSKTVFRKEIAGLRELIEGRLLPSFVSIEKEAAAIANDELERYNANGGPDCDPGTQAEAAEDAGAGHYLAMVAARQGLLNLFAVGLHHLVEQQQMTVFRQELIQDGERANLKLTEFVKRLTDSGIGVTSFDSWPEIEELRNVANAVKHAEGKSAEWLRNHRPEIFDPPCLKVGAQRMHGPNRWLFQPLSGEDLFVTVADLERYFRAAEKFWREFEEALAAKARRTI